MADPMDLKSFERNVVLRELRLEDFDALVRLQQACFPGMATWKREQIESQIGIFPEGQLCVEVDGALAASAGSLIVDFSRHASWHDWRAVSDGGYIRNHDPKGDTLYGIEIMVDPKFRGQRLARRLYERRKEIARAHNLQRIVIGGRIPGYGEHADRMSAREYVDRVASKEFVDPVLTTQIANGFVVQGLIPNYFPADKESRGYAIHLEWINLDYRPAESAVNRVPGKVRLCLVQYMMRRIAAFEEFAAQVEFFTDVAADYRADFVVFPELFTTQLLSLTPPERPGLAARRLAGYTPRLIELMRDLAVRFDVNIIGGSQFVLEGDTLYNEAFLFRRNGSMERQRKLHITPNERRWWGVAPGSSVRVFETDRGRVAILICYDVEFPEMARIAVDQGAKILFVPFNTDERYGYLRVRHCAQARAIENQVYVAIAGCVGTLPRVHNADVHYAQCAVFTPSDFPFARDAIAAESMPNIETVVVQDVDLDLLHTNLASGTVRPWADRRRDLYAVDYREPEGQSRRV